MFRGHSRSRILGSLKSGRGSAYNCIIIMCALESEISKEMSEHLRFREPHCHLAVGTPYLGNPCAYSHKPYIYTLCLKKSMWCYLFEHNSNINCPIIIIFGTAVTETMSYWIGVSFFHLTYLVQHHYLGNHTTWKFANSAINYFK